MKLTIHRGTKQIGGNIVEVATDTTRILLDCGRNLPPLDGTFSGDTINIEGLTRGKSHYDGVFVTHYHADHCGLLERVNPDIPIYMSQETQHVLAIISDFIHSSQPRATEILQPGREVQVGDIQILPLEVRHSAKGAVMFLVKTEGKKLLYTGDFNYMDDSYPSLLGQLDVLLCEGTNISVHGDMTEDDVEQKAAQIMSQTQGQVFVLCSTTNIDRIYHIEQACRRSGRTMAFDPFAKAILEQVGQIPLENLIGFVPQYMDEKKTPRAYKHLIINGGRRQKGTCKFYSTQAISKMTSMTFLVRQTMGDFLKRLERLSPLAGSTLIYSMWRGYENTAKTREFLDICRSLGIKIEYLHVSGHAYQEVLASTILQLQPKILIPIHTESAEAFRDIHNHVLILEDGETMEI